MLKAFFNIGFTLPQPPSNLRGQSRADYIARRKFYDMTAEYNYFSYTLNGKKVVKNKDAEQYYTRGGAGGLFNLKGTISEDEVREIKAQLKESRSIIWHGIISFDDDTSKGFETQENAVKFLNQTFNAFIDRTQLNRNNICVYASLHKDTDHRHIHFAFFEKEPLHQYKDGTIDYTRRGTISQRAIDNYLVSANMHLSEHGDEYYSARDRALDRLKELRRQGFDKRAQREVRTALTALALNLPEKGRLQYNSKNMEQYRPMIDRVVDLVVQSDPEAKTNHIAMMKEFARVQDEVRTLAQDNSCAAEGHVSHILSARMSSRPMGWSKEGAYRIARLRAFYFNGGDFRDVVTNQHKLSESGRENTKEKYSGVRFNISNDGQTNLSEYPLSGHVVGIDGLTDKYSSILRAIIRNKKNPF